MQSQKRYFVAGTLLTLAACVGAIMMFLNTSRTHGIRYTVTSLPTEHWSWGAGKLQQSSGLAQLASVDGVAKGTNVTTYYEPFALGPVQVTKMTAFYHP